MANQLVVISWRDIPAQVNAQAGRRRHQVVLDERFQLAIDRAAIVAGKTTAQDYVEEWRRVSTPCGDDLEAARRLRPSDSTPRTHPSAWTAWPATAASSPRTDA